MYKRQGIDRLIEDKLAQKESTGSTMTDDVIRLREEISEQIVALKMMKQMAASYGCDISKPAANVQEAIQATYFGYLSAVKEQNGAAMSLGRTSTFLDIYSERDLCLLYTSDAADDLLCVDLGGRRIIKKKTKHKHCRRSGAYLNTNQQS